MKGLCSKAQNVLLDIKFKIITKLKDCDNRSQSKPLNALFDTLPWIDQQLKTKADCKTCIAPHCAMSVTLQNVMKKAQQETLQESDIQHIKDKFK